MRAGPSAWPKSTSWPWVKQCEGPGGGGLGGGLRVGRGSWEGGGFGMCVCGLGVYGKGVIDGGEPSAGKRHLSR